MSDRAVLRVLLVLVTAILLLFLANVTLFIRVNTLQSEVLEALKPFQRNMGLPVAAKAPEFELANTNGEKITLSGYLGHRILIAFTSTTCGACEEIYPEIRRFSESESDTIVLMISKGSMEENRQMRAEQGFRFPVLTWTDEVSAAYQVPGTPFFYVVNSEGAVGQAGFAGSLEQLREMVHAVETK
ncbi:MAG: redoxin domain-containing protein [Anaerolineales bacterium]|nr:redoxin domain-containing protein [Anaerolineales bacterium]